MVIRTEVRRVGKGLVSAAFYQHSGLANLSVECLCEAWRTVALRNGLHSGKEQRD